MVLSLQVDNSVQEISSFQNSKKRSFSTHTDNCMGSLTCYDNSVNWRGIKLAETQMYLGSLIGRIHKNQWWHVIWIQMIHFYARPAEWDSYFKLWIYIFTHCDMLKRNKVLLHTHTDNHLFLYHQIMVIAYLL